ncbi:MAG: hypothetical protein RR575_01840 [Acinetobacter sp.]
MSFAALFWSVAALIQCCMLSQYGQKQLQYQWLNASCKTVLFWITILMFIISFAMNCLYEGSSVGALTWLFVILTTAFFIQVMSFYFLRKYFVLIWLGVVILAVIFTVIEWMRS